MHHPRAHRFTAFPSCTGSNTHANVWSLVWSTLAGGMSAEVQEKFLSNGVDCQEIYELQVGSQSHNAVRLTCVCKLCSCQKVHRTLRY